MPAANRTLGVVNQSVHLMNLLILTVSGVSPDDWNSGMPLIWDKKTSEVAEATEQRTQHTGQRTLPSIP